jgi:parallel beta-helix repeat protein
MSIQLLHKILLGAATTAFVVVVPASSQAAGHTVVVTTTIQAAVDAADPGDTVVVPDGVYRETVAVTEPGITITGSRAAVLDGVGQGLFFGIRVRSLDGSRLDGFTLDGLTIRGYTRSGIQLSGVDNFRLTRTSYVDNPLYGLFPVRCTHGRVDHNEVSGSLDSGVYVGQCADVLVDHNIAHDNTIGLEVELSSRVVVEDNTSTDNTVGAVVQILPGRDGNVTDDVLVRRNVLSGNNRPNTVTGPGLVGLLPSGIGVLNMAGDNVRIVDNIVSGNRSGGIGVISLLPDLLALEPTLDPAPDGGEVRRNVARGNGYDPDPRLALFGLPGADVVWDGTGSPCFEVAKSTRTFPSVLPACG